MSVEAVFVDCVDTVIDADALQSKIADPDVGAHGWFHGVTRRTTNTDGQVQTTNTLSYETHRPMAMKQLQSLAESAKEKFGLTKVVIVHRIGEVPIGEASVVVGCSSPHRVTTFQALPWIMDVLKKDCLLYTSPSPRDRTRSRMPSSA